MGSDQKCLCLLAVDDVIDDEGEVGNADFKEDASNTGCAAYFCVTPPGCPDGTRFILRLRCRLTFGCRLRKT